MAYWRRITAHQSMFYCIHQDNEEDFWMQLLEWRCFHMVGHCCWRRRYRKRHHHSGTEERSAMHTSDVVGHVDSLCLFLNALNTVWKRHPLSIGDIGLCSHWGPAVVISTANDIFYTTDIFPALPSEEMWTWQIGDPVWFFWLEERKKGELERDSVRGWFITFSHHHSHI